MSLHIYLAHSGEQIEADPVAFTSLDALRSWISRRVDISAANQILMTARGRHVKLQTLLTEKEIFVFDRLHISPAAAGRGLGVSQRPVSGPIAFDDPPDSIASQTSLQAWQSLFQSRRTWATELLGSSSIMATVMKKNAAEASIISRAVDVAIANLQTHVRSLEQKHSDAKIWAGELLKEQETTANGWDALSPVLARIPIKAEFMKFASSPLAPVPEMKNSLKDFIDAEDVGQAINVTRKVSQDLAKRVKDISGSVEKIMSRSGVLLATVEERYDASIIEATEEAARLMEDVEVVAKKVATDTEHVLKLTNSTKSISQMSKMALLHTRNYLPSLKQSGEELGALQRQALGDRNRLARDAVQRLQTVSAVESMLASVNSQLSALEVGPDGLAAFELLNLVPRIPIMYGSLLIESTRRREWAEMIKADSSKLAEDLAGYKEEEERRRKKWQRSVEGLINTETTDIRTLGVELNLQGDERPWPLVQRSDIDEYIQSLNGLPSVEGAIKEVSRMIREIEQPTRQQSKMAKAFKSGSIYGINSGRGSLLMRGNVEVVRSLKDEKQILQDRLKGSESRVRKLEDLLHRHSHVNRSPSGNIFQASTFRAESPVPTTPPKLSSPRPQVLASRTSSYSTRRFSATANPEERTLIQRIVRLEADLIAERENAAGFQKEAASCGETVKLLEGEKAEREKVKKDLVKNLEAQHIEFASARKMLKDNMDKAHQRVEEVEDELDRVLGSRDQGIAGTELRIQHLEAELQKSRDIAESLREGADAKDQVSQDAYREKQSLEQRIRQLEGQLRDREAAEESQRKSLEAAYSRVSPSMEIPATVDTLVEAIEETARATTNAQRQQSSLLEATQTDLAAMRSALERAEAEAESLRVKTSAEDIDSDSLRTALIALQDEVGSLKADLERAHRVMAHLEADLTGAREVSEDFERRVESNKTSSAAIREDLVHQHVRVQSLKNALSLRDSDLNVERRASDQMRTLLASRTSCMATLSERLYAQKAALHRLLDVLGYVITSTDGGMSIQRVSKTGATSTTDVEAGALLGRSMSGTIPTRTEDVEERALVAWIKEPEGDVESEMVRYVAFMDMLNHFDLEIFSDTITKRVKETEHLTRRWQKEARSYREKSHRFQLEAHEKIAFRSFKEGDLALFLPTRNQATRPWAAFNVGAPHYFLREQDTHKLRAREWLLARISKVEERMVDLSKSINGVNHPNAADRRSVGESSDGGRSIEDENPFELSDGLRWYLLDAAEEKPGAPSTPGLGKSTVASVHVDVKGSIRLKKPRDANEATRTLSKSLDSRRGSSNSRKSVVAASPALVATGTGPGTGAGTPRRPLSSDSQHLPAPPGLINTIAERERPTTTDSETGTSTATATASVASTPTIERSPARSPFRSPLRRAATPTRSDLTPTRRSERATSVTNSFWDSLFKFDVTVERVDAKK